MLLGGLQLGSIVDFYGASGVGKTQLCMQVSAIASAPRDKGGANGDVLYVDPTGSFRPERLKEIAEARGLDAGASFTRIYLHEPRSLEEQMALPNQISRLDVKPRLLVIDSVVELFLESGDAMVRSMLGRHLHSLSLTALKEDIAILLTNPVRARPGREEALVEAGGNIMAQGAHFRLRLSRRGRVFSAEAVQPPLRPREVYYRIGREGLVDV